jgi:biopolymer transport protein ExbD
MLRRRKSNSIDSKVEIPITPMLDMTFQLLAFFVLTFQPQSVLEGAVHFSLPAPTTLTATGQEQPTVPPTAGSEEEPTKVTLVVKTVRDGVHDGNISALILQADEGELLVRDVDALKQTLTKMRPESGKGQIRIAAECGLKYACVMEVMDVCVQSGFTNVGFATPPDLGVQ